MQVAVFNESTGWAGRRITHEGDRFVLEAVGPLSAADVLAYDTRGFLTWERDELRDWVRRVAAYEAGVTVSGVNGSSESHLVSPEALALVVLPANGWRRFFAVAARVAAVLAIVVTGLLAVGMVMGQVYVQGALSLAAVAALVIAVYRLGRLSKEAPRGLAWLKIALMMSRKS